MVREDVVTTAGARAADDPPPGLKGVLRPSSRAMPKDFPGDVGKACPLVPGKAWPGDLSKGNLSTGNLLACWTGGTDFAPIPRGWTPCGWTVCDRTMAVFFAPGAPVGAPASLPGNGGDV